MTRSSSRLTLKLFFLLSSFNWFVVSLSILCRAAVVTFNFKFSDIITARRAIQFEFSLPFFKSDFHVRSSTLPRFIVLGWMLENVSGPGRSIVPSCSLASTFFDYSKNFTEAKSNRSGGIYFFSLLNTIMVKNSLYKVINGTRPYMALIGLFRIKSFAPRLSSCSIGHWRLKSGEVINSPKKALKSLSAISVRVAIVNHPLMRNADDDDAPNAYWKLKWKTRAASVNCFWLFCSSRVLCESFFHF